MSDDKKVKLTAEKLQQLQQLQEMMMQQQHGGQQIGGGSAPQGMPTGMPPGLAAPKRPSKLTPKGMLIAILQGMQNSVKFVDHFINFVIGKNKEKTNDVVESARSPIMFGTVVLVCFVFVGVGWSFMAPLDSAAVAIGTVVSNTQKKTINHQEGGIIKQIYVKIGDEVKANDKLLEFDATRSKAEYANTLHQYRTFLASETRLLAEINEDDEIVYPEFLLKDKDLPVVAKIIETQNSLFKSKREMKNAEKSSLEQRIKQTHKQIEGLNAKKVALQKTLEVTQDRLEATRKLNKQGFAQKAALLEFEAREANAQSDIAQTDTEIIRSEQEITKINIEFVKNDSTHSAQSLTELKDAQVQLAIQRENSSVLLGRLSRMIIRSPVDGIVNNLNFHTVGMSVPNGQTIVEISPDGDTLVIEVKIPPKNIDSIRVGLVSKIRFSAFKSRTTPLFMGKVVSMAPDIVIDPRDAQNKDLAAGHYLARIELDMEEFERLAEPRRLVLHPGMQAEVQIVTGTRTLIKYLLDPVFDAMFKGFKEK